MVKIKNELMHIKHLIKEAIEKGVPIEDYIKSLDSSHRYYPLINRKNTYENNKRTN
jgi:hypothetical protein